MAKPLTKFLALFNTGKFVKNVAKPLPRAQVLVNIREFILQRKLKNLNLRKVAKALIRALTSLDIREHILERNLSNVVSDERG